MRHGESEGRRTDFHFAPSFKGSVAENLLETPTEGGSSFSELSTSICMDVAPLYGVVVVDPPAGTVTACITEDWLASNLYASAEAVPFVKVSFIL